MEGPAPKDQTKAQRNSRNGLTIRSLWRRVENVVFGFVLLLALLYFMLQMPAVQNWLVHRVAQYLSQEWQTTVSLQRVDVEFFDKVVLEGLYVEDVKGDTLIYAGKLNAGLKSNFFAFLGNEVEFNDIGLSHARLFVRRAETDERNTLNQFIDKISGPRKRKKQTSGGIRLKIQNLHLDDVMYIRDVQNYDRDDPKVLDCEYHRIHIPYGLVRINLIDPDNKLVDIQSAHIDGLTIDIQESERAAQTPKPPAHPVLVSQTGSTTSRPLIFRVGEVLLTHGAFRMDHFDVSPARSTLPDVMDYDHLDIHDIELQGEKFTFNDEFDNNDFDLKGTVRHLAAREQCGFVLSHAEIGNLSLTDTLAGMYQAKIQTAGTTLGDTILFHYNRYRDLRRFDDSVDMDIRLTPGSFVRVGDLTHFDDNLADNQFFKKNYNETVRIRGHIYGLVNRLRADNLQANIDGGTSILCDFRGNNLSTRDEPPILNFDFKELRTSLSALERIIPGFRPPAQFYKLGYVIFKGSYQLFDGVDHVLYGDLDSDLGGGRLDMQLNLKDGREKASYSGRLEMRQFDMATWTGDKRFGPTTFNVTIAENSTGLTLPTIKTKITGKIDTLSYLGYHYRDILLNGSFNEKIFDGQLTCNDPNVDFTFDGVINLREEVPRFDFNARMRRIDLGVLHLVDKDLVLFGNIENLSLVGNNLDEITGSAYLSGIKLLQDREEWHRIDSLRFVSFFRADGSRYFGFNSDVAKCEIMGKFSLNTILQNLGKQFSLYHPEFARQMGLSYQEQAAPISDNYRLLLQIRNSKNLTRLFLPDLDTLKKVLLNIHVEAPKGLTEIRLETPFVRYGGLGFEKPDLQLNTSGDSLDFSLDLPETKLSAKRSLPPIQFTGKMAGNLLNFVLEARDKQQNDNQKEYFESLFLKGGLSVVDSLWQVQFNSSRMKMFSQEWLIADENYVRFNDHYFETKDFEFFNGNKRILLEGQNNGRGVRFSLTNFDLNELNRFFDPEFLSVRGKIYDFDISVQDIFKMEGMEAGFLTDTFFLNSKPYGVILSNIEMADLSSPLLYRIFLQNNDNQGQRLRIAGAYLPKSGKSFYSNALESDVGSGEIFASVTLDDFPLDVIETFIPDISKTAGAIKGNLTLQGPPGRVGLAGFARISGQTQIDYLKAMIHLDNQKVNFTPNKIEVSADTIWDASLQHMAYVDGYLSHDYFSKWRVSCNIESADRSFLVLNTTRADNELYYGQGIGYFLCNITGSFSKTNILVDAETGKNTRLYIPLSSSSDAKEANFIRFTNSTQDTVEAQPQKNFSFTDLKGLNFEMNLTVTEDAEVQLIFDEQAGDIIKSWGTGDIKLNINRDGDFKMYGRYQISRGDYLFTLLNFVNKPFTMVSGGTISWFGDPYRAILNLDATYEQTTAVYNFVRDEVELLSNLRDEASKATRVVATMHLSGELLKPNVSFDLAFPNVTSQLKSLTDNKLRLLKQDQNELSRQIFGLVVIGSFLPPNTAFIQPSDYAASLYNTLTQMIGNQFSNYLAGLASEWFKGDVSSIDFDIAYNDYQNALSNPDQPLAAGGRELQVRLKSGFKNDRITVQVGSQFGLGSRANLPISDGFLGEDVTIEMRLTKNNQWRLKIYQRLEPDISGQRRDRYGLGISFQKDYDSFGAMLESIGDQFRRKHREQ